MFSVDFASVALCGLPEGLVLAEVVAAVLRAGAEPHTVPAPGAIWQQLQAVGYCTAVALALVLLVLLVVMMRRRTDTRKQASRRFMMQQRIVYVLSSVVFVVVHFAMATAVRAQCGGVRRVHVCSRGWIRIRPDSPSRGCPHSLLGRWRAPSCLWGRRRHATRGSSPFWRACGCCRGR